MSRQPQVQTIHGVPRRCDVNLLTANEKTIQVLIDNVESMGPDPFLSDVVSLLSQAKDRLADFVDSQIDTGSTGQLERL